MLIPAVQMPKACPFWERHVTLGRLKDGSITFVQAKGDKDEMLRSMGEDVKQGAVFFVAWTGKWTTNLFLFTDESLVEAILAR